MQWVLSFVVLDAGRNSLTVDRIIVSKILVIIQGYGRKDHML